jgi:hypothetical protein
MSELLAERVAYPSTETGPSRLQTSH